MLSQPVRSAWGTHTLDEADGVEVVGSGFRIDGNEGAGVDDVCLFVDERDSDGFRWREEGESVRVMLLLSAPFFECECK